MLISIAELKSHMIGTSKIKLILLATPIIAIGSGLCYYYYFYNNNDSSPSKSKKNNEKTKSKRENEVIDPIEAKLIKALDLKNKGNESFRKNQYDEALKLYSEAIMLCPPDRKKELSTFYQNRAACYEYLQKYEDVIKDTTKAINYDKHYVKAYLRRGKAFEKMDNYDDASYDYYVASNESGFQNSNYIKLLSDCLEKFSCKRADEITGKRKVFTFQKYLFKHSLNKYRRDPLRKRQTEIINNYNTIINQLLNNDDDDNLDDDDLLLKGTIEMYIGKHEQGKMKLMKLVEKAEDVDYKVNALLKIAEHSLQNGRLEDAEKFINNAIEIDPNNCDIYYVRSQYHLINRKYEEPIEDLSKAIELDPDFLNAIGQKLYIKYQQAIMTNNFIGKNQIMKEFERYIEKFPASNELSILYFQILLSDNENKKAENLIEEAIKYDPDDPTLYVYKALIFIEQGNMEITKKFLDKALEIDDKCSYAYEMLADLCSKLQNLQGAIDYLEKAINISTTYEDIKNLFLKQKSLAMQMRLQSLFSNS